MILYKIKKNKTINILNEKVNCCNKRLIEYKIELDENVIYNNYKICKKCIKKNIEIININEIDYYLYENNLYKDIINKELIGILDNEGYLNIDDNNIKINKISINGKYYYLILKDLYMLDNIEFNKKLILKKNSIGKLLGPNIAIINKEMIIIKKVKYNLWRKKI